LLVNGSVVNRNCSEFIDNDCPTLVGGFIRKNMFDGGGFAYTQKACDDIYWYFHKDEILFRYKIKRKASLCAKPSLEITPFM
jgi:hypothetical protein